MKTMALMCAAVVVMAAGSFGMYKTGWFSTARTSHAAARQQAEDPLHSAAAMQYRNNQSTSWRLVMTVR
jgi:hypothetical protein